LAEIGYDPSAQFWVSFGMLCGVVFLVITGIALVVAGWGLLGMKQWARWLAFILAIISLFAFPIGTVIGAVIIWYLLKDDVTAAFEEAAVDVYAEIEPITEEAEEA
jgi:thiosulfate reductase cytochrome b subunit